MADAWRTVVHRQPEWDEQSRTEAIAAVLADQVICPKCGNVDTVVEVQTSIPSAWVWESEEYDDKQVFQMKVYRCIACAGIAVHERAMQKKTDAIEKPDPLRYLPSDATWGRATRHIPATPPPPQG